MILILGGTTEGRVAVKVADEAASPYYYSTKGDLQAVECAHGVRLTGAMNAEAMESFCQEKGIRLLIDAAHPFASALHQTLAQVAARLDIPVIRYERLYPPRNKTLIWCDNYQDAMTRLQEAGIHKLLALTGVNTLASLRPYWEKETCWFRILNREDSLTIARDQGFPEEQLVFFHEGEEETKLIEQLRPEAILTKESGYSGYFMEKVEAAGRKGIPVFVIKRPLIPGCPHTVYGENGLRKQIERLLPDFFPLRSGYTTGSCATAAAKAALLALLTGQEQQESTIILPSGEPITLPVASTDWTEKAATCIVTKDAGDDPDVTNGCSVVAQVELCIQEDTSDCCPIIHLLGGEGIGTVTLPGLGLEVGGPAINATPRRMITQELTQILQHSSIRSSLQTYPRKQAVEAIVTLSIPGGEELARRTFNPKLGIIGGISILGTSGIVRPFSSDAFIASIRKEAQVAKAIGASTLVINSGAKSEQYLKSYIEAKHAQLPPQAFIHFGNFIGETLQIAAELHFPQIILGIMLGKAVKLAEGALDTHSKKGVMNKDFLKSIAQESHCSSSTLQQIETITLARELSQVIPKENQDCFFSLLLQKCKAHCAPLVKESTLSILLISENGEIKYKE